MTDAYVLGYQEGWEEALAEMLALLMRPDDDPLDPMAAYQQLICRAAESLRQKTDGQAGTWRKTTGEA